MVQKIRKQQGITQAKLAKGVGVTRPYISKLETSQKDISGSLMLKIAHYLNTPVEEVFNIADMPKKNK